jgi:hypothetical protein
MKQKGIRPFLLQMARQPCNRSVPWSVILNNSVQFRRCRGAWPQDCGGRSARNPQEKIVAEISPGDRDTQPPALPRPQAHCIHHAAAGSHAPLPLARISTANSEVRTPPRAAGETLPLVCLLCQFFLLRVPRQLDPRADGRGPRGGGGTGRGRDATAASAPAGPVMPAVAVF